MTTDTEIKLLPCPCCGRQDLDHNDMLHSDGVMRVRCVWCNCEAPEDAWNRRVSLEAGQPAADAEPCKDMVPVRREAVDWLKKHYPALCEKSGLCERVAGRLYTRTSLAASAAPAAQEPVGYLACNPETGKPEWGEGCICENNVYSPEDTGTVGRPVVFAASVVQGRPVVNQQMTTETKNIRTSDPYDDPIFERLCREHEIWGTPQSALCAVFWRSSRASVQNREDAKAQIVAEYNRWTHAHASGQSYDDFLKSESAARAAKGE